MGGSDVSAYAESFDAGQSDPDSDIPGELQVILNDNRRRSIEDTLNFGRLCDFMSDPTETVSENNSPPSSPVQPVFRAQLSTLR